MARWSILKSLSTTDKRNQSMNTVTHRPGTLAYFHGRAQATHVVTYGDMIAKKIGASGLFSGEQVFLSAGSLVIQVEPGVFEKSGEDTGRFRLAPNMYREITGEELTDLKETAKRYEALGDEGFWRKTA
jgi:hypothetical protein